jgi:hypothetical protein
MDAFKVQAQIRQNATEMQDFLKDLGSWEKNIKQRDRFVQSFQLALGYVRILAKLNLYNRPLRLQKYTEKRWKS